MRTDDRYRAEPDDHQCTEPLEDEDGRTYEICQEPVGAQQVIGGGEFPDPATPPRSPAPGSVSDTDEGHTDDGPADDGEHADDDQLELPWQS